VQTFGALRAFRVLIAGGSGVVLCTLLVARTTTPALAAPPPFRPAQVEQAFRTTGFVVLPDIAVHLPKWLVMDYGFNERGTWRHIDASVNVYVNSYRARQAAVAIRSGRVVNGGICSCRTLRVRNALLLITILDYVKPSPPPHYLSDRRVLIAALSKLGKPVSP
jgi:hypothetical protein